MVNTKRDIAILKKLGGYGILSTRQIGKLFFLSVDATTVRRRLRILEKQSLVYRVGGLDDGGVGWALTAKGSQAVALQNYAKRFNRNSIKHDILLNDVRLSFDASKVGNDWIPEHELKRRHISHSHYSDIIVPDALFSVTAGNKARVIALELELNSKSHKRYERILNRYIKMKSIWALWYIVPSTSAGESLAKLWNAINYGKRNDLFMWSLLDEVLARPRDAIIYSEHFKLPLKDLFNLPALPTALPESDQNATSFALPEKQCS